jgi:hypothetical protein
MTRHKKPDDEELLNILANAPRPYTVAEVLTALTEAREADSHMSLPVSPVLQRLRILQRHGMVGWMNAAEAVSLGATPTEDIETRYWAAPQNVKQWEDERAGEEKP